MTDLYSNSITMLDGRKTSLEEWRGKVILIVNTASKCGFTPQYAGLEALHRKYGPQGLVVLGAPCNQFGAQEPGDAAEIQSFCTTRYDVDFPMTAKLEVNGANAHPLFQHLKAAAPGLLGSEAIKWNFTKFLIDRSGQVVERFAPTATPESLASRIETLLAKP